MILEINPRHNHLSVAEIQIAMQYPVSFAINSDAHSIAALGDLQNAAATVAAAGLPLTRIINIE